MVQEGNDVIAYCTWPHEASSVRAARLLKSAGVAKASALRGGLAGWRAAGYPVETG